MAHHPIRKAPGQRPPRRERKTAAWDGGFLARLVAAWVFHPIPWLPSLRLVKEPTVYGFPTFGSFLFMVGGLYLPKVLKLKVGGLELEKAPAGQVPAPSTLAISRSGSLTS